MTHRLLSRRPLPGARPADAGWELAWGGTRLMGIVNVTPDSFSDGGRFAATSDAVARGVELARDGAWIVDIGGESTRPGADPVPAAVERDRVIPVIAALAAEVDALISVDTSKPEIAKEAVEAGAHLVNDVTGLSDPEMLAAVAECGVPAVVMHMQGRPRTMQRDPAYRDVVGEVEAFLLDRAEAARAAGVPSVVLDPGLGFGKTVEHNVALTRATGRLASHGSPVLIGASRKHSIGVITGEARADRREAGSVAWHLYAASAGAALVRVHDVAAHAHAFAVWRELDG